MKKYLFILSISLVFSFLYACHDGAEILPTPEIEEEHTILSVILGAPRTKAVDEFDTPDSEKEIKSVACLVQTNDTGEPGSVGYKQGGFFKYLFDNVEKNDQDQYVVNMEIHTASVAGETEVVMIANYKENGLENALNQIISLRELENLQTNEVTGSGLSTPLLMYTNEKVALQMGTSVTKSFVLKRLMARVDIYNEVPLSAKRPFILQSAQVINPKLYSYLVPGNDDAFNIPVFGANFDPKQPISSDPKKIEGLYTYETANDGSVEHTSILIKGTLGGEPYSKEVKLLKGTTPVPLARNTRYLITLNASSDPSEISFSFSVEDWSEGITIPVKPSLNKPLLTGITFGGVFNESRWNEIEKIYNMEDQTTTGTISFSITGKQEIIPEVVPVFYVPGSEFDLSDIVKGGDVVDNRDGTITQYFTIEVSTAGQLALKEPVDIYVYLKNSGKPSYREVICITNLLNYPGTNLKPVSLGGLYWAPVNVGATEIIDNGVLTLETMGYVYQWGRTYYPMVVSTTDGLPMGDEVKGPVSYSEATGIYSKNYIYTSGSVPDWLNADDPNFALRNSLWSNPANTPCPPGWRLPINTELEEISKVYSVDNLDSEKLRVAFPGTDGQKLYLPLSGWREYKNGGTVHVRIRSLIWASNYPENNPSKKIYNLEYSQGSGCFVNLFHPGYAFYVRCVRM